MQFPQHKFAWLFLLIFSVLLHLTTLNLLPVLDRDEARFAQATKQMFETGDFLQIKFQDEYRNKKPIGIHWLQSIFVSAFGVSKNILDQDNPFIDSIWIYRLTSGVAGCLSVLLIYFLGRSLVGQRAAFIAASLLNISILFVAESHVAKTDSCLLVSIIITMLTLGKFYLKVSNNKWDFLFLWLGLSATILIKGPIGLIIFLTTIFTLSIWDKDFKWEGFVPFDRLPRIFNPENGFIVTANNKIANVDYPFYLSLDSAPEYRAKRITERLKNIIKNSKVTPESMISIHSEITSIPASIIVKSLAELQIDRKKPELLDEFLQWDVRDWEIGPAFPTAAGGAQGEELADGA